MLTSCTHKLGVLSTTKLLSSGFRTRFEHLSRGPRELSLFHFLGNLGSKISWLLGVKTTFKQKESNHETIKYIYARDFRNKKKIQFEKVNNWKDAISPTSLWNKDNNYAAVCNAYSTTVFTVNNTRLIKDVSIYLWKYGVINEKCLIYYFRPNNIPVISLIKTTEEAVKYTEVNG